MAQDIFDLFRNNQDKLNEAPSPQAWNRLERRLNSRRPSVRRHAKRVSLHRPLGMVAGLALLLTLVAGLIWLSNRRPAEYMAQNYAPVKLEHLAMNAEEAVDFQVADIVRRHPVQPARTVAEGLPRRKLVVKGEAAPRRQPSGDTSRQSDKEAWEMSR